MNQVDTKIYTHLDLESGGNKSLKEKIRTRDVAESEGMKIRSFRELKEMISILNFENPRYTLLYRGQKQDYKTRGTVRYPSRSSIFPSIFRHPEGESTLSSNERTLRFDELKAYVRALKEDYKFRGSTRVKEYTEIAWAILQHYKKTSTPLIDLTSSPLTAASFALQENEADFGYFYCFAIPHQTSSINFHIEDRICSVRLASACPPDAKRAHIQDAYFIGRYPHSRIRKSTNNISQRMVAKFKLKNAPRFWDDVYKPLREEELYPKNDDVKDLLERLKPLHSKSNNHEDDDEE